MGGAGEAADVRPHAAGHHPQGAGRGRRQGGRGRGGHREPGPARRAGAHGARLQGRRGRQRAPDAPLQGPARPVSTRTRGALALLAVYACNQLTNACVHGWLAGWASSFPRSRFGTSTCRWRRTCTWARARCPRCSTPPSTSSRYRILTIPCSKLASCRSSCGLGLCGTLASTAHVRTTHV